MITFKGHCPWRPTGQHYKELQTGSLRHKVFLAIDGMGNRNLNKAITNCATLKGSPMSVLPIRKAILSVFDKTGIDEFAKALSEKGVHILSTGGTGRALSKVGVKFQEVSDYTGSPEMLGGRVKTLHPKIHGGLLFKRNDPRQVEEAERYCIYPIDLVAVNLYPFESTVAKPNVSMDVATENIDIGGPTMIRSAAKNFLSVVVITDPRDYPGLVQELNEQGGITLATRHRLAAKAFAHTSHYDSAITAFLTSRME